MLEIEFWFVFIYYSKFVNSQKNISDSIGYLLVKLKEMTSTKKKCYFQGDCEIFKEFL